MRTARYATGTDTGQKSTCPGQKRPGVQPTAKQPLIWWIHSSSINSLLVNAIRVLCTMRKCQFKPSKRHVPAQLGQPVLVVHETINAAPSTSLRRSVWSMVTSLVSLSCVKWLTSWESKKVTKKNRFYISYYQQHGRQFHYQFSPH